MVDAADLKSVASNGVRVQVPPRALFCNSLQKQVNKGTWAIACRFNSQVVNFCGLCPIMN